MHFYFISFSLYWTGYFANAYPRLGYHDERWRSVTLFVMFLFPAWLRWFVVPGLQVKYLNDRIKVNGGKAGVHPDIEVKQDGKTKVIVAGGKTEFSKRSLKVPFSLWFGRVLGGWSYTAGGLN
jgi:hypothetical protein